MPSPSEPPSQRTTADRRPALIAAGVFLISLFVFARITPGFTTKAGWPTGDEPYYLLVAHSIIHDHDIDLTNNYDNQDYWHYYPGELYPRHEAKTDLSPASILSTAWALALLIVPAYALGDWRGSTSTSSTSWARCWQPTSTCSAYEVSRKHWVALLLWLTLSFTNPLMSYTFLIFPALVSALLTIYAFRRIRLDSVAAPLSANGPLRLLAISFCLGFMPWLHARFLPVSLRLFAYLVWREWSGAAGGQSAGECGAAGHCHRPRLAPGRRVSLAFLIPSARQRRALPGLLQGALRHLPAQLRRPRRPGHAGRVGGRLLRQLPRPAVGVVHPRAGAHPGASSGCTWMWRMRRRRSCSGWPSSPCPTPWSSSPTSSGGGSGARRLATGCR